MSLPIDPRTADQAELERRYRESVPTYPGVGAPPGALAAHRAAHDVAADAWLLSGGDPDKLAAHQASRARTGEPPLNTQDPDAVALAVHRAHEREKNEPATLPLEAAAASPAPRDDSVTPATPEVPDRDDLSPEGVAIVSERVSGIVHAVHVLCAAVDGAAAELTRGRRRGSGLKRIRAAWPRQNGRPRGAGADTPAAAVRELMHAYAGVGVRP